MSIDNGVSIDSIYNILLHDNYCYEIKDTSKINESNTTSCLIRYNLDTLEECYIDNDVVTTFVSDNKIYYIKRELNEINKKNKCLYEYKDENNKTLIDILKIDKDIISATYDSKNKGLYFTDYKDVYYYVNGDFRKSLSVLNAKIEIKSSSELILLLGIGPNQLSIYQMEY